MSVPRIYLLDTNHASEIIRDRASPIRERLVSVSDGVVSISAITKAELVYCIRKRPEATKLAQAVAAFLRKIKIFSWTDDTAEVYGSLRAGLDVAGRGLGSMDLMIAAHALELNAILLTSDKAFLHIKDLRVENWTH